MTKKLLVEFGVAMLFAFVLFLVGGLLFGWIFGLGILASLKWAGIFYLAWIFLILLGALTKVSL